jgi:gluconokinase
MTHAGDLDELASQAPPGSNGLIVLPFLTGERAPMWSSDARAVMFGLSLQHRRSHFARGWMEGVAYALRTVADLLEPLTGKAESIRAGGGFVNSHLWVQILADVMELPVSVCDSVDSSTIGAALIGLSAIGELELSEIDNVIDTVKTYEPDRENKDVYSDTLDLYRSLSRDLGEAFKVSASLSYEHPERLAEGSGTAGD